MEHPALRDLLALLTAEADRHGGSVKIEQVRGQWRVSLSDRHRDLVTAQDEYLESALARLWAAVGAAQLDK